MNRGSHLRRRRCVPGRLRFNEAPIHESGKSPRSPTFGARPTSFNEAPIHESGKCDSARESPEADSQLQ